MWSRRSTVLCLLASLFGACLTQRAEKLLLPNPCSSKTTCSDCIQTPICAWCFADKFSGPRCLDPKQEVDINASCGEAFLWNPKSLTSLLVNNELSRGRQGGMYEEHSSSSSFGSQGSYGEGGGAAWGGGGSAAAGGNLIQIKPQVVEMRLRLNEMQSISFAYSQAKDYPVDLYYLMDLSRSMKNDKEKLSALGSLLSSTMKNITSNFNIGFGSFVDKLVMPYVSTVPRNLESPCDGCAAPYGFRNQMSLSMDTDGFESAVAAASVSGNLDAPEGGFDAIMQAVVCKDKIGWRDQSRKLLVFSTDAGFHYAGDGKLGGIVQPNDGECHMENNLYTHSTKQDYPSISQINLKVKKNAINVIFAVTAEQIAVYNRLSQHIEGSSTGVLSDDSDNVVDLVRDQYNKITSTVEMRDSASKEVQVVYYSSCLDPAGVVKQTNKCEGLKVGDIVEFTAEITLKECPEDPNKWKQALVISPVGVPESMTVNLEFLCGCDCEREGHPGYKTGPDVCNGRGVSACGVCVCNERFFGKQCECSAHEGGSVELERGCRPANASSGVLCSGRGSCICGVCECHNSGDPTKVISGPYCECDNFNCNRYHEQLCAGPERGECVCGACVCRAGYTGPDCSCPLDTSSCRSLENGEICSGHGECQCGQCVCKVDDENHYSGRFCEKCPTCPGKCAQFRDCVLCEVHGRGPMLNETHAPRCGNCSYHPIVEPGKIEANENRSEHLCSFYDDEDCLFVFTYYYTENQVLVIRAQKERECPKKVPILGIILGVIAAIVLVGLALLMLWKMVTTIHDRREFARFEKERMSAKWDTGENPIYKQATSTFKNPTYAGK